MKRLAFCFDGTWNRLDAQCSTNVVITAESILPLASDNTAQLIYYHEGVGTGRWDRIRGGMFGSGLLQNLADAYRFLIFNYTPGDDIFVFGFSRGAYTARSFVGLIGTCGLLARKHAAKVGEAIELYRLRDQSTEYATRVLCFRRDYSPEVCVSHQEDQWRVENIAGYFSGRAPAIHVRYLGVWDTVGALGIPASFTWLSWANRKYQFHDTKLSSFVRSARHAVAIDEHRKDFTPTLWDNLEELNTQGGAMVGADDAPYQQKWFPGVHSSVGGGGERRGLSDQALDWVLDGARCAGLELDAGEYSRIYELAPNYREFIESSPRPSFLYEIMNTVSAADRSPGPSHLYDVSISARRRWLENPQQLRDGRRYRPRTLASVVDALKGLDPVALGVGAAPAIPAAKYTMHQVKPGDALRRLAVQYYGDGHADDASKIFLANLDKLENPDRIYVGQTLRIPFK